MAIVWRESSVVEEDLRMAPGLQFDPTEDELIQFYLSKIVASEPLPVKVMKEIDAQHFYQHHPKNLVDGSENLSRQYFLVHGDEYFHGRIDKVKLVGEGNVGSWSSLGKEEEVVDDNGNVIGFKIHSTFLSSKSKKTNWRMKLYRLPLPNNNEDSSGEKWVIARIRGAQQF
ncbi:NAC domain-containing protein 83-like [Salvia hispanica]|uniref:NAC domain-containing protein 83-like n=1 Tax=Salvia hispanica TaxID=49212 RepID=UPI0020098269|nr:NAC domain-containing protein 83-like [Salvia hispanica]